MEVSVEMEPIRQPQEEALDLIMGVSQVGYMQILVQEVVPLTIHLQVTEVDGDHQITIVHPQRKNKKRSKPKHKRHKNKRSKNSNPKLKIYRNKRKKIKYSSHKLIKILLLIQKTINLNKTT